MMKRYLTCLLAGFFLTGCNTDNSGNAHEPNEAILRKFQDRYPSAQQVSWEEKGGYMEADFWEGGLSHSAWFGYNGQWYMTKTELNDFNLLPPKVQNAFRTSGYAGGRTDDLDRLDRPDAESLYVIEVQTAGQESKLYYTADGILFKHLPDNDDDDACFPGPET